MALSLDWLRSTAHPRLHASIQVDCVAVNAAEDTVFTDIDELEEALEAEILQLFQTYCGRGIAACSCEVTHIR